jgi:hypothetical protein
VNLWQTLMKRAALVVLAAAVVVPVAQAAQSSDRAGASSGGRPVAGYSSKKLALQELTAIANSHPHVSSSHLKELMATANNLVRGPIVSSVNVQKPASASSGGFDWGDAGIGATSGFAFALILAGTLLFLLRRRSRGQGAGTPKTA